MHHISGFTQLKYELLINGRKNVRDDGSLIVLQNCKQNKLENIILLSVYYVFIFTC